MESSGSMPPRRALGETGITIAPLVFGGNVFGWTADEARSFELLDAFVDAGFDAIDTANSYSAWIPGNDGTESERIIGAWLRNRPGMRERVRIFTKVGADLGEDRRGVSARQIATEVEGSLRRLGIERIDLYQTHYHDPDTPAEETLGAYARLIEEGKVRAIGASNHSAAQLRGTLEVARREGLPRYETLQPHYNLHDRDRYDGELRDLAIAEGLGVIPYYALASGFLTGKYRSAEDRGKSPRGGGMDRYLTPRGFRILEALDEVAASHGVAPVSVAIAWLLHREGVTAPIASATRMEQLPGLFEGVRLRLSAEEMAFLTGAGEEGEAPAEE